VERNAKVGALESRIAELLARIDKLTRIAFAPKSERRPLGPGFELLPGQMHLLFPELIEADGAILEVACWAHARRRFLDAKGQEPEFARQAIDQIRELYALERAAKEAGRDADGVRAMRQAHAQRVLARFAEWMSATKPKAFDKGALADAIRYAESNWDALQRYTTDGRLDIDNNAAERGLRKVALGRNNWIFFGNERGGRTAAIMYSLIATCEEHGVDPRVYLRDVLMRIKTGVPPVELTPYAWKTIWQPKVEAHRASILERMLQTPADGSPSPRAPAKSPMGIAELLPFS